MSDTVKHFRRPTPQDWKPFEVQVEDAIDSLLEEEKTEIDHEPFPLDIGHAKIR